MCVWSGIITSSYIYCTVELSWQVTLSESEGGGTHWLLTAPSDRPVAAADVYEYVQRYAELRMLRIIEEPLQVIIINSSTCAYNILIYF